MLKIVIGTNEGKLLCISNNEDEIKASMVNYLIDTDQEPTEDFFESRNWGEYDIEVYEYHQPQLNPNQQIVLEWLKKNYFDSYFKAVISNLFFFIRHDDIDGFPNETSHKMVEAYGQLSNKEFAKVLEVFSRWVQEQEEKQ
nr:MAG TPA: hypothetical protein [Caudoviricetes sp.]